MKPIKRAGLNALDRLMQAIIIFLILVFVFYPFVIVFYTSMIDGNSFDLSSFEWARKEWRTVLNSLTVATLTMLCSTFFSILIAIFHFLQSPRMKKVIFFILMLTIISPPFVTSLSYINLFGRRGLITYQILKLSFNPYGLVGIVSMESLGFTSMNALILIGFLSSTDQAILESARSLGAKTNYVIKDIILPSMRPALLVVMLLSFIRSLADFSTPAIIGGSYKVMATEAYYSIIANGDLQKAATISVLLFIPALLVFLLYAKQFRTMKTGRMNATQSCKLPRKGFVYRTIQIGAIFFLAWILLQYIDIFLSAITDHAYGKLFFTTEHIKNTIPYISGTFLRSIVYSLIAGFVCSVLGLVIEYYAFIRKFKWMKALDFIATMPYIVPGTFFGIGYILAFNHPPLKLTGTALIVVLNVIFKQLPFASKIGYSAISQIPQDVLDSAQDLGSPPLCLLKDVVFPMSKNNIFLAFVNGFTATMTTIGSIIFLVYPTQKLATLVMFDVIESGKYGVGSVIACLLILICLIVNGLYAFALNLQRRHKYVS